MCAYDEVSFNYVIQFNPFICIGGSAGEETKGLPDVLPQQFCSFTKTQGQQMRNTFARTCNNNKLNPKRRKTDT